MRPGQFWLGSVNGSSTAGLGRAESWLYAVRNGQRSLGRETAPIQQVQQMQHMLGAQSTLPAYPQSASGVYPRSPLSDLSTASWRTRIWGCFSGQARNPGMGLISTGDWAVGSVQYFVCSLI